LQETSPLITIKSISNNQGSGLYLNNVKVQYDYKEGMNVLVLDPMTGEIIMKMNFNTAVDEESDKLSQFIESLPVGSIVAFSSHGKLVLNEKVKQTISNRFRGDQHKLDSLSINNLNENSLYCSIGKILDNNNNNNNNISPLFNESIKNNNSKNNGDNNDEQQATCLLRYPLDYLFNNVDGYNINVKSKAGTNHCFANIQINGVDIIGNQKWCQTQSIDGLNVVIIKPNESNHSIHQFNVVDDENQWFDFYRFVNDLPSFTLIIIAIQKSFGEINNDYNKRYIKSSFKLIGGSLFNNISPSTTSDAIIGYKGTPSSNAHESICNQSSLVSISSWEPKYRNTDEEMKAVNRVVGRDALFSVPLFEYYYKLSNPIAPLLK